MRADLAVEMIPYTAKELISIGEEEFKWIEEQMVSVSDEMSFGADWKAALEHTKNLAPPPGEIPWVLYDIADYSENFIEDLEIIDLPPLSRGTRLIRMRGTWPPSNAAATRRRPTPANSNCSALHCVRIGVLLWVSQLVLLNSLTQRTDASLPLRNPG